MAAIRLIVNPSSGRGRGRAVAKQAAQLLAGHGVTHEVCYSVSPHEPTRLARQALVDGAAAVVGIGGDGLVSQVAAELVGTRTPLGIIPAGRGNDFARGLGIPLDIPTACATLAAGRQRRIDVGQANGRYFFSMAVMGLAAEINRRANALTRLRTNGVYTLLTLATVFRSQPQFFSLEYEGGRRRCYSWLIAVGNTWSSGRGMALVPAARPDDGQLDACVVNGVGRLELLSVFPRVFKGRHVYHTGVETLCGRAMTIHADQPGDIYADGERIGPLPARLETIPQALSVFVPAAPQRGQGEGC
ncbi:MAG: diacylglycerol kinase family lipid kinase [Desulfurellaceae bacterium]|nr:diacylglycerol kinase family lipid kinase [Desulfurellaceae bacterium]